jgi:Ca2+:H+ antiporter
VFVPIGYITYLADAYTPIVFTSNALAVVPLSNLLTLATMCIARDMGDNVGAMLNISFGNLIEMIIL